MIKTLIIDDEPLAIKHLVSVIGKFNSDLEISATAASVTEGLEKIKVVQPELIFLDIQLTGESSFDLLRATPQPPFEIIFVTAYDQFGIQAVKAGALDYILKPINKRELALAIEKACSKIYQKREVMLNGNRTGEQRTLPNRLTLPTMEGLLFIDPDTIMYCESEGRYTRFYLKDESRRILVSKNLGEYENLLPSSQFIRIHHHSIVNINYIDRYVKGRGGYVVLKNGKNLPVSSRKKELFFDKLS